jgi:hypothetical protein
LADVDMMDINELEMQRDEIDHQMANLRIEETKRPVVKQSMLAQEQIRIVDEIFSKRQ